MQIYLNDVRKINLFFSFGDYFVHFYIVVIIDVLKGSVFVLNAKNVKIAYASVKTEIIDDMLYIVLEDGRKIELPLYAEWCDFDRKGNVVIPISWGTLHVLNRNCIIRSGDVTLYTRGQTIPLDKVYVCAAKHDKRVYLIAKKVTKVRSCQR